MARGNLASLVETVQTAQHTQAMIHGLRCGWRLPVQLMTDVFEQDGIGDLQGNFEGRLLSPAGEVQQIVGVDAEGTERQLSHALGIEKGVGPIDFVGMLVEQTIGANAGALGRLIGYPEFHTHWTRWRQSRKSLLPAPERK